jgi:hypothetical protein
MAVDMRCRPVQNSRATSRAFDDEAVVIDPTTNIARMFNSVGTRVWDLADGTHSIAEIASIIAAEYAVTPSEAEQEVSRFVEELVERELVTLASP